MNGNEAPGVCEQDATRSEAEDLILYASQRATGATIHDTNGLIGCIRACLHALDNPDKKKEAAWFQQTLNAACARLRYYVATGDYKEARRRTPFPE